MARQGHAAVARLHRPRLSRTLPQVFSQQQRCPASNARRASSREAPALPLHSSHRRPSPLGSAVASPPPPSPHRAAASSVTSSPASVELLLRRPAQIPVAMDRLHVVLPDASAAAPLAPANAATRSTAPLSTAGVDACLAAPLPADLPSPSAAPATAVASARAASLTTSGLGLPGYPACTGALTGLLSPTCLPRQPCPGFSTTRPLVVDATWASTTLSIYSTMSSTIAVIQVALSAS
jgi:hypothetical protein